MTSKILFIHNNHKTIESFQELFERWDLELIIEPTCTAGIERIIASKIDGVLLDLDLLETEGLEMLTTLRNQHGHILTIVMGSADSEHLLISALTKGAQDFLFKPISTEELYDKCLRLFG